MKRLLSLALASALLLAGCGPGEGPGGRQDGSKQNPGGSPALASYALAQPVYPKFPTLPQVPTEMSNQAWEIYNDDYDRYIDALTAIRGGGVQAGTAQRLTSFAGRSAPLVLEGQEGKNVIYSPLSLWSALAMLAQCAGGESCQQVLQAIDVNNLEGLQAEISQLWRGLYTNDGTSSLLLSNSIWLNSTLEGAYIQNTLDTLAEKYFAGTYSVPMGSEADQAVTSWVKEQTNGLIGGEAPVVQTRPSTLALLVSSLYYRAGWMDEFMAELTSEDTFTGAAGQEQRTDFMHMTQQSSFLRREGWQSAYLTTQLGEMIFVLPDEGVTPESLLQSGDLLTSLDFTAENGAIAGEVQWSVPKFDVDSSLDLKSALAALGITDLLEPDSADLTPLTDLDAYLSEARQLARVKVDEEGVEAAAATILMLNESSIMPPEHPEICVMDLDRPFLFVIRHEGIPLFVGIVNQM